jgi:hypothetical protein
MADASYVSRSLRFKVMGPDPQKNLIIDSRRNADGIVERARFSGR